MMIKSTVTLLHDGTAVPMTESVYRQADHNVYTFVMELFSKHSQKIGEVKEEAYRDYVRRSDALMKLVCSNPDNSVRTTLLCLMVKQNQVSLIADVSYDPKVAFWDIAAQSFFDTYVKNSIRDLPHRLLTDKAITDKAITDKAITSFAEWYVSSFNRASLLSQHIIDKRNGILIAPKSKPIKQNANFRLSIPQIKAWINQKIKERFMSL